MDDKRTPLLEDDEEIALAIIDRDEQGLVALLTTRGPKILGHLKRHYGHILGPDEREHILHLAATKAWQKIDQFDDTKGDLGGWFFRIAQNQARDYLRHHQRQVTTTVEDPEIHAEPWLDRQDRPPEASSLSADLERALGGIIENELSQQQREVVLADMAACDQADNEYLAESLGTFVPAVHTARSKAHKKIREALQKRGFDILEGGVS